MAIKYSTAVALAACNAIVDRLDAGGTIEIYDGVQPATADTAVTNQNLLVTFQVPAPGFGPATDVAGQTYVEATGAAIESADPVAGGTATWARVKDNGGAVVFDGNVGNAASTAYARMSSTAVTVGVGISVLSHTFRQPKQ